MNEGKVLGFVDASFVESIGVVDEVWTIRFKAEEIDKIYSEWEKGAHTNYSAKAYICFARSGQLWEIEK